MPTQRKDPSNDMNNQTNKTSQKGKEKSPGKKKNQLLQDMEICDINEKEFKNAVMKKYRQTI